MNIDSIDKYYVTRRYVHMHKGVVPARRRCPDVDIGPEEGPSYRVALN